jgi:DNA-binding NarL/FixJ family response regulator
MPSTILIVEDHAAVRSGLRSWLEAEFPQCRVMEVSTGEEAIALTQTESPQLVIMDIRLQGINGLEATRRIKASSPSVHIVMLTLCDGDVYRAEANAAGASAYVPKHAATTQLIPTLAPLLANGHGGCST